MPETTVQKMIGAITILISLMKPSPSALIQSLVASAGHSQPTRRRARWRSAPEHREPCTRALPRSPAPVGRNRCRHDVSLPSKIADRSPHAPIRRTQPKSTLGRRMSMALPARPSSSRARSTIRRIAGTSAAPSAFLISGRRDERRDADQPRLFDAEFHAERQPAKSGGENEDVAERHRRRTAAATDAIPAAFARTSP